MESNNPFFDLLEDCAIFIGSKSYIVLANDLIEERCTVFYLNPMRVKRSDPEVCVLCAPGRVESVEQIIALAQASHITALPGDQSVNWP